MFLGEDRFDKLKGVQSQLSRLNRERREIESLKLENAEDTKDKKEFLKAIEDERQQAMRYGLLVMRGKGYCIG